MPERTNPQPSNTPGGSQSELASRHVRVLLFGLASGEPHECSGQWLVSYDPNYHWTDGHYDGGILRVTKNVAEAGVFTHADALALIMSSPDCECHRLRQDGCPNRPLTAFSLMIEEAS